MNLTIRPMTKAERKYSYTESYQLMAQTGCIGHLRGDMGNGQGFFTSWDDHVAQLKTDDFKTDLDAMVNALRFDGTYDGILSSRSKLAAYCYHHPESGMNPDGREYGFRADTDRYTYMLRLNPNRGEYNMYIYCYVREQLDSHMRDAEQGIRFITPDYRPRFRLTDGDSVRVTAPDGRTEDRVCRYIDETHLEYGSSLFHICEFAERMEKNGNTVIPLRSSLPEKCFAVCEGSDEAVIIRRGIMGWTPTGQRPEGVSGQAGADALNEQLGVSKPQAAAMLAGSMFGWACPGADPANYDGQGRPIKPRTQGGEE